MASPQSVQQNAQLSAQNLAALMVQIQTLNTAMNAWVLDYNQNSWDAIWQQMPTAAVNGDGSVGPIDVTAGTGTVAVTSGSTALAFNTSQSGLAGKWITITGDSTNGLYLVINGTGENWVLAGNYNGSTNAAAGWNTSTPNLGHPIYMPFLLLARNNLITAKSAVVTLQTVLTQVTGTVAMPNQSIIQTAAILAPNTLG